MEEILEGAGKTSLFKAILNEGGLTGTTGIETLHLEADDQDGIAGGLCYSDSAGVNLQVPNSPEGPIQDLMNGGKCS